MQSKKVSRSGQPAFPREKDGGSNRAAHSKGVRRHRNGKHFNEVVYADAGAYVAASATDTQRNCWSVVGRCLREKRFKVTGALDVYRAVVVDKVVHVMPNEAVTRPCRAIPYEAPNAAARHGSR